MTNLSSSRVSRYEARAFCDYELDDKNVILLSRVRGMDKSTLRLGANFLSDPVYFSLTELATAIVCTSAHVASLGRVLNAYHPTQQNLDEECQTCLEIRSGGNSGQTQWTRSAPIG